LGRYRIQLISRKYPLIFCEVIFAHGLRAEEVDCTLMANMRIHGVRLDGFG
jgi:hypothetical protein